MKSVPNVIPLERRVLGMVHLLSWTSILSLALTQDDWTYAFIFLPVSAIAWLMIDAPRKNAPPLAIPKILLNIAILLGACYLFWEFTLFQADRQNLIVAITHFVEAILCCKMLEVKTARNALQLMVLTLLIIVTAAIFSSSSIPFSCMIVAYMGLFLYAAAMLALWRENPDPADGAPLAQRLAATPLLRHDLRTTLKRCALMTAPLALALFLIMPRRSGLNLLAGMGGGSGSQSGFSEIMTQSVGTITQSDAIVMNVRITRDGQEVGTPYTEPYFRGSDADSYEPTEGWRRTDYSGHRTIRLRSSGSAGGTENAAPVFLWGDANLPVESEDERQDYELFSREDLILFTEGTPIAIDSDRITEVYLERSNIVLHRRQTTLPLKYTLYSRHGFLATDSSQVPSGRATGRTNSGPAEEGGWGSPTYNAVGVRVPSPFVTPGSLGASTVPPQVDKLAHEIAGDLLPKDGKPLQVEQIQPIVQALENYLKQHYAYSLTFWQQDSNVDMTTDFLLNHQKSGGSCSHFASALTMMCRALGIHARLVTGYHGGDYNATFGYYVVRRRDAHAWVEYYLPREGWVISDPTPAGNTTEPATGIWSRWSRDILQFIQTSWLSGVVAFDDDSRATVFATISAWTSTHFESMCDAVVYALKVLKAGLVDPAVDLEDRITAGLALVGIMGAAVWFLRIAWKACRVWLRKRAGGMNLARPLEPPHPLLEEAHRALRRLGPRRADQTPMEFVEAGRQRLGPAFTEAKWLVETAYAAQFGYLKPDAAIREKVTAVCKRVKAVLHSGTTHLQA